MAVKVLVLALVIVVGVCLGQQAQQPGQPTQDREDVSEQQLCKSEHIQKLIECVQQTCPEELETSRQEREQQGYLSMDTLENLFECAGNCTREQGLFEDASEACNMCLATYFPALGVDIQDVCIEQNQTEQTTPRRTETEQTEYEGMMPPEEMMPPEQAQEELCPEQEISDLLDCMRQTCGQVVSAAENEVQQQGSISDQTLQVLNDCLAQCPQTAALRDNANEACLNCLREEFPQVGPGIEQACVSQQQPEQERQQQEQPLRPNTRGGF
jgi:hypothetical protein